MRRNDRFTGPALVRALLVAAALLGSVTLAQEPDGWMRVHEGDELPQRWRRFLEASHYDLQPLEVECTTGVGEARRCRAVPGTSILEHPYFDLSSEALRARPDDPLAHYVLGIRQARSDPAVGLPHMVQAAGLSGGRPGPLVDLLANSDWALVSRDGVPAVSSMQRRYVIMEAARQLGHEHMYTEDLRAELADLVGAMQVTALDAEARSLVAEVRAIEPAPAWSD